jgi:5-methyltetrahydrofolate--homocysteine methyltransferase
VGLCTRRNLSKEEIIKIQYQGIRPALGYPACPEHSEKQELFRLLMATERTGITLTENFAMYPTASVSGLYFAHPESYYFGVDKLAAIRLKTMHAARHAG